MDYESMVTFISSVGFPIIACFMMYKQNVEVLEKIRDVVEKNTLTIKELIARIENERGDKDEN